MSPGTAVRSVRGPVGVVLALVLTGLAVGLYSATGPKGALNPQSYSPEGSHAVAALLARRGIRVERVENVSAVVRNPRSTVFVPAPDLLSSADVAELANMPQPLVVVAATGEQLAALRLPVRDGPQVDVATRDPACALPAAVSAGNVDIGGVTYESGPTTTGCYAAGGRATLVDVPARRLTLLGSADLLTNARLADHGNAALGLRLLGTGDSVQWLLPVPGAAASASRTTLSDLIPRALKLAAVQLLVAAAMLALWRGRQLGRVVHEPLPVVVRAAEAVEGRSRLYRAARARPAAAAALQAGARDRLAARLGLGPEASPTAIVTTAAARTGADPAQVHALLYGAAPTDDDALVLLADNLDRLDLEVAGS